MAASTASGARNPSTPNIDTRRLDLPVAGWAIAKGTSSEINIPPRVMGAAGLNKTGKPIDINLNTYRASFMPNNEVFQYDVQVNNGIEKRGLVKRVWNSKTVQDKTGSFWIFDGNRIAWSMDKFDDSRTLQVDLDVEDDDRKRRRLKGAAANKHVITFKRTTSIKFDVLHSYLAMKCSFDNKVLEALNFLDHLMREEPSRRLITIRKSFFDPKSDAMSKRSDLGRGVETSKGVFSSVRIANDENNAKATLTLNVDVANGCWWQPCKMDAMVQHVCGFANDQMFTNYFQNHIGAKWLSSTKGLACKRFKKLRVETVHLNNGDPESQIEMVIDSIAGISPAQYEFEAEAPDLRTGEVIKKKWRMTEYYKVKYKMVINQVRPVAKMTKKINGQNIYMPLEALRVKPQQRYPFKLSSEQTEAMIKVAVEPPKARWASIQHGLRLLNCQEPQHDKSLLKKFKMRISPTPTSVKGVLLPSPNVQFSSPKDMVNSQRSSLGRWDVKGKKFLKSNGPRPLECWGVFMVQGEAFQSTRLSKGDLLKWVMRFVSVWRGHGGNIANGNPVIEVLSAARGGDMITDAIELCKGKMRDAVPQLLVFAVPDRDSFLYERIKKSMDCRYGVPSQVLQQKQVIKMNEQYMSNVCLKVNAKLGGASFKAVGTSPRQNPKLGQAPNATLIIGADVSHGAPGSETPSMAAMTVSQSADYTRYSALVDTNGVRAEMISPIIMTDHLHRHIQAWMQTVNQGTAPAQIIYVRDGVSEGEYAQVVNQEIRDMKALCRKSFGKTPSVTCLIASKRHHVRLFPLRDGDRNQNARPGTLVETGICHPFENDWYLCSQNAIQGTARPVHYHLILNECKISNQDLQQMLFDHSFQYVRSTTPVSIFPAVYYAHLASKRAASHENRPLGTPSEKTKGSDPRKAQQPAKKDGSKEDEKNLLVPQNLALIRIPRANNFDLGMWYV